MTRETAERIVAPFAYTGIRDWPAIIDAIAAALVSARADGERDGLGKAANIALAIDSGRGNEKEIASAIRLLKDTGTEA